MFVLYKTGCLQRALLPGAGWRRCRERPREPDPERGPDPDPDPDPWPRTRLGLARGTSVGVSHPHAPVVPPAALWQRGAREGGEPAPAPTTTAEERATEASGALPAERLGPAGPEVGTVPLRLCGRGVAGRSHHLVAQPAAPRIPAREGAVLRKCGGEAST